MSTTLESPRSRITARMSRSTQAMLEEAAAFLGVPVNSFLVSAAMEKAGDVLAKERVIKLSPQDAELVIRMMENPPAPTAYALECMADAKQRLAQGDRP